MKDRRPIFFTSDWHIGHANVIIYSKRPFKDVDDMERVLINNFNSTVTNDSITYFLGDMGMCTEDRLKKVIDKLNGTKILILGNHDKGMNSMYKCGFDVVLNGATLIIAKEIVTLSHCPMLGVYRENTIGMKGAIEGSNWHGEHKNQAYSTVDRGQFHLHGHIHSPNGGRSERTLNKQFDVGVDANNYRPLSISVIESWIAKYNGAMHEDKSVQE